jgi:hypothetical protein
MASAKKKVTDVSDQVGQSLLTTLISACFVLKHAYVATEVTVFRTVGSTFFQTFC